MKRPTLFSLFSTVLLIAGGWLVAANRQGIVDRWQLFTYHPTPAIQSLADTDKLSDKGRNLFYTSQPTVADKAVFANNCPVEEATIVLGCYNQRQIYILQVNEERLKGVEQVTAAHEMLHAAYQRLSKASRSRVDALLETAYAKHKDERLLKTVTAYEKTEPGERSNELHSILGTEVSDLGPELESYYKKYFVDRTVVVNFAKSYQGVFTQLENQVASYDQQLATLKSTIDTSQTALDSLRSKIDSERQRLELMRSNGQTNAYNAAVPGFNAMISQYNAGVIRLQANVANYNTIVAERNKLATTQRNLTRSLQATNQPLSQ